VDDGDKNGKAGVAACPQAKNAGATRRSLLLAGIAPVLLGGSLSAWARGGRAGVETGELQDTARLPRFFLTQAEERILTALVDRILPRDEWPSASDAGVVTYFDVQLATAWGDGEGLFRKGPFAEGKATQGYQLPYTPAEFYRRALGHETLAGFADLGADAQDALLTRLQKGEAALGDIAGGTFFTQLRQHTMEGYFTDPIHGGNRDLVGWRMIGFPGAHAYYLTEVDRFDLPYRRPPSGVGHRPAHARPPSATMSAPASVRPAPARP
jgi:hypothetical protein